MDYDRLSSAFAEIKELSLTEVGEFIGGKVQYNIQAGFFQNACTIRLSHAFVKSGVNFTAKDGARSSGANKKFYLYRVNDMKNYVKRIAKETFTGQSLSDFFGKKGVIVFSDCGWCDATGHVDLFDGTKVESTKGDYSDLCRYLTLYIV